MSSHDKVMTKLKAMLEVGHALKMRLMAKDGCEASILKELNNGVRKLEGVLVTKGTGQQPDKVKPILTSVALQFKKANKHAKELE